MNIPVETLIRASLHLHKAMPVGTPVEIYSHPQIPGSVIFDGGPIRLLALPDGRIVRREAGYEDVELPA